MMIKKRFCIIIYFLCIVLLSGCSKKTSDTIDTDMTLNEILGTIVTSQTDTMNLETIESDSDSYLQQLEDHYALSDTINDMEGVISKSIDVSSDEFAVFHITNSKLTTDTVKAALEQYILNRKVDFLGYAPYEVEKLDQSTVAISGDYIALIICNEVPKAVDAFFSCFTPQKNSPTNTEIPVPSVEPTATISPTIVGEFTITEELIAITQSMFDNHTIVEAYQTNNPSLLTNEIDIAIYEKCVEVIEEVIDNDMDDYDKELAIHDYLIDWTDYDKVALRNETLHNEIKHSEYADTPYGLLINQTAICSGYTTTVQLFMDLLGIPCLSIPGHSVVHGSTKEEDHAWNIVFIDESWYYVDVTWDDPVYPDGLWHFPRYDYFNTTTLLMKLSGHKWEDSLYPDVRKSGYRN